MRHNHKYVKYFAFCWPLILLVPGVNWWVVYGAFCFFLCLGIELGLHRIACHGASYKYGFRHFFVFLGLMTYSGGVKNSALSHVQHHNHADTSKDVNKKFGIKADFANIPMAVKRKMIRRIDSDRLLVFLDNNHNILFLAVHILALLVFGPLGFAYVTAPAAMAVCFHDYIAVRFLHSHGYENFHTDDNSKNSLWLYPLMWGANFHNNHHHLMSENNGYRWWEIDFIFWTTRWCYDPKK